MAARKASNGQHADEKTKSLSPILKRFDGKKKAVSLTLTAEANEALTELVNCHRYGAATGVVASEALILLLMTVRLQKGIEAVEASGKLPPQIVEAMENQNAAIAQSKPVPQLSRRSGGTG